MIFGVVIGTYSSIFIAAPVLIYLGSRWAARLRPARRPHRRQAAGKPRARKRRRAGESPAQ